MQRRGFLQSSLAAALWSVVAGRGQAAQQVVKDMKGIEELQKNWKLLLAEGAKAPLPTEPLKLSKEEWRKRLPAPAYNVLREEGTERAGTSPLNQEKRDGVFACAGCDLPLFTSAMKYESGTGWPSFSQPSRASGQKDYKMVRAKGIMHTLRRSSRTYSTTPSPTGSLVQQRGRLKFNQGQKRRTRVPEPFRTAGIGSDIALWPQQP